MMEVFGISYLDKLDKRQRAAFVNSLSGFKSANLVGTKNSSGQTNLCVISSCFHLGANPSLMGFIIRPHTVPRHTLENIIETKLFSINHINKFIAKRAHQTSARYDKGVSEFDSCNLTEYYHDGLDCPMVEESHIRMIFEYKSHQLIEINETVLVIGELKHVELPKEIIRNDFSLDIESAKSLAISGLDTYHQTTSYARYSYAKVDKELEEIE